MPSVSVPAALATTAAVAGVASAGIGVYGAISSAHAQSEAAKYNAAVAEQNQQQALRNASLAAVSGDQQAAVQQQKTRAEAGAIKAQQAASNIDVNTGSAVDVQSSAAELGELNAITIRSNAAREAYGYQTQATSFQDQAGLDTTQAANDTTAGTIGATSTILGGLSNAANNYTNFLRKNSPMTAGGIGAEGGGWDA